MRWDPARADTVFFNQSAILYTNYYVLQILVHRSFIPSPRRPLASANLSLPSMVICVSASRACLRVLEVQHRRLMDSRAGFTLYALTPLQMPLFELGVTFLTYLWAGGKDVQTTMADVRTCLSMLKDLSTAYVALPPPPPAHQYSDPNRCTQRQPRRPQARVSAALSPLYPPSKLTARTYPPTPQDRPARNVPALRAAHRRNRRRRGRGRAAADAADADEPRAGGPAHAR